MDNYIQDPFFAMLFPFYGELYVFYHNVSKGNFSIICMTKSCG